LGSNGFGVDPAIIGTHGLHGFSHRFCIECTGFCTAFGRPLEVFVSDLELVLGRHLLGIADPTAYHVQGVAFGKLGFAARPQRGKQLRPRPSRSILSSNALSF
jgi:hypothetical protein